LRHIETPPDPLAWSERIEPWPRRTHAADVRSGARRRFAVPVVGGNAKHRPPPLDGDGHVSESSADEQAFQANSLRAGALKTSDLRRQR
jgi:hypothetical protein